jgi:hypothetical protein
MNVAAALQKEYVGEISKSMLENKGSITIYMNRVDNGIIVRIDCFNGEHNPAYVNACFVATDYDHACGLVDQFMKQSKI